MFTRETVTGIRATFVFWLLTALIYPAFMLIIGQTIFPYQANGSLIKNDQDQVIGSTLIGQNFTSDRYFTSRPSAVNYAEGDDYKKTGVSGASNLAPSNPDLIKRIQETTATLKQKGIQPTADLVYSSGSGLDPHISIESAQAQIERVAQARGISPQQVTELIQKNTDQKFLSLFGEPGVNVLKLNIALDQLPR
ncbi:potassium-transporting ATPase subunit C [Aphanothece hegewaldii CCALA 016]|uniref:Potassium-transporting ATPase KdpC subunit n=1 Tax=Aphanothece hegewaldii CCALA 016 TaxID=2107694 RepID=A0A2T1M0M6_9CHRO|nr:K(+)-transporting ATPase subunit C [Aphanothece hegewaldii]PSF38223.1 potassium-transporting ATPase subunit C [Aphanothece hegewaldii CCALA 016]